MKWNKNTNSWSTVKDIGYTRYSQTSLPASVVSLKGGIENWCLVSCPSGWKSFKGNCYKHFSTSQNWTQARSTCQAEGGVNGDLVSILDEETNTFIRSFANTASWIGGFRLGSTWGWSDESEWNYENWYPSEPSNSGGPNAFVAILVHNMGLWGDYSEGSLPFVCQIKENAQVSTNRKRNMLNIQNTPRIESTETSTTINDSFEAPVTNQLVISKLYEGDLPRAVNLDIVMWYDETLLSLDIFDGSETKVKQWISVVNDFAKVRLAYDSLNVRVNPIIKAYRKYNDSLKASETYMQKIKDNIEIEPNDINIFFCHDAEHYGEKGIASIGSACRRDGYAISIVEYWDETNDNQELNTARVLVHEIGHILGMW